MEKRPERGLVILMVSATLVFMVVSLFVLAQSVKALF